MCIRDRPYPKPVEAHPTPHFIAVPGKPLSGPHLGYVRGPENLALKEDGSAARIDKAFTWENPLSAHGLMHMLIPNAHAGDPYRIDTLFLYMANMAWNSSMNSGEVMKMLTDKGADGEYVIPRIIYSDAYASEMVAYADLILPDTTYLEPVSYTHLDVYKRQACCNAAHPRCRGARNSVWRLAGPC